MKKKITEIERLEKYRSSKRLKGKARTMAKVIAKDEGFSFRKCYFWAIEICVDQYRTGLKQKVGSNAEVDHRGIQNGIL